MVLPSWTNDLNEKILGFLSKLEVRLQPGRYLPCVSGVTYQGKNVSLGFSCFALKIYYMLGHWDKLENEEQKKWISYIKSFQNHHVKNNYDPIKKYAFIDTFLIDYLESIRRKISKRKLLNKIFSISNDDEFLTNSQKAIIAETKQAIASLAEIGEFSDIPYCQFPNSEKKIVEYMEKFDWSKPWASGGQTSALTVFMELEGKRKIPTKEIISLQNATSSFFESIVDSDTGGYFSGNIPNHGMLVNGAMKVLTALDWLNVPIHFPEKLIDTTLSMLPKSDGCHLVDAVYVLHRCCQRTNYKRDKIKDYFISVLDMIRLHHNKDGGFSYNISSAQKSYYGLPISKGYNESDIHGTVLLTWALSMIFQFNNSGSDWKIIKP
tara:strand:- start:42940 stop:44076 length:1137 start_codon:yes stop_codon:yes gene_type:complete